jgi:hypothetical protein
MAKEIIKRGATSNILRVFLQDSTVTTGAGKTGLGISSTGLIISTIADVEATATTYTAAGSTIETVTTLGTYAAPTATKCRFREVDATNFPGVYEIQIADARFAVSNSTQLLISVQATGIAPVYTEYQLVAIDLMDTVRLGLTALPNVASGSAGAIITSGTGTAQLSTTSGAVTVGTNNDKTGYSLTQAFPTNFSSLAINGGGAVTAGTVSDKTGYSLTQAFPANFSSLAITAGGIVTANTTQWAGVAVTGMPMPTYTQPTGFLAATFPGTVSSLTAANVWDTNISGYTTAGYAGTYLKGAGSSGDPWSTAIPGSYGVGTAGYIVGNNLNATITSRMATYTQPTGFLTATFPTTVASTTNITAATGITLAAVTHTGATIPTVTTVTNAVTAGTVSDKTGYSLATSQTFSTTGSVGSVTGAVGSVTGAVGSVTGNVGGDVSGKVLGGGASSITGDGVRASSVTGAVGSVTSAVTVGTINANAINAAAIASSAITAAKFATDAIDANAVAASAVTEIQAGLSTLTAAQAENAVWNATTASHTTAGTYGQLIVRTDGTNGNEVKVTAAHHIAADIHEVQPGTFVDADWAAGSTYAKLATLIEADTPTGYRYTAQALETAPTGGGGGGSTTVRMGPFTIQADGGGADQPLDLQKGATHGIDCTLVDGTGTGVDLTGATLSAKVYNSAGTLVETLTGTATYAAGGSLTWTITTTTTNTAGTYTATITRTTGASDTQVFGPLRIYVRDI